MTLVARPEPGIDFAQTAALAAAAFEQPVTGFRPERMAWLYGRAFSQPSTVIGLFSGDRKVGQAVAVGQPCRFGGHEQPVAALMDVFILQEFRSREAITTLYRAVEQSCRQAGYRALLAVPNGRAVGVNRRILGLETLSTLDIRVGAAWWAPGAAMRLSTAVADVSEAAATAAIARYLPGREDGLAWTADRLWSRLQAPGVRYGLHATDNLLLVSAPRTRKRLPVTLLCGTFVRPGAAVTPREVRAATAAACRLQGRPLFVYVGRNAAVPLPGVALPDRLRPSLMIVQARDLSPDAGPLRLERFECIDFDLA